MTSRHLQQPIHLHRLHRLGRLSHALSLRIRNCLLPIQCRLQKAMTRVVAFVVNRSIRRARIRNVCNVNRISKRAVVCSATQNTTRTNSNPTRIPCLWFKKVVVVTGTTGVALRRGYNDNDGKVQTRRVQCVDSRGSTKPMTLDDIVHKNVTTLRRTIPTSTPVPFEVPCI